MLLGLTDSGEGLLAFSAIFFVFGAPIMAWTYFRMLAHRERMEMIRHGLIDPVTMGVRNNPRPSGMSFDASQQSVPSDSAQGALRKGLVLAAVGLALTIGLSFIGYHETAFGSYLRPGPWLIGGLIPLFIGAAQIMIAIMSGAQFHFGPRAPQPVSMGSPAPQPGQPAPTYEGSYTYRPGGTQELRPPTPPPTTRDN